MKKNIVLLLLTLTTCVLLVGCNTQNMDKSSKNQETSFTAGTEIDSNQLLGYSSMLHYTDSEAIDAMGEGEATYQNNATADVISARLYQNNVLGFTAETVLVYGGRDNPTVNEILITFAGAVFGDVVDAISQQLGDATTFKDDKNGNAEAQWQHKNTVFNLTTYNHKVMLGIWEDTTSEKH
ncbi:MAG: hypothetical protein RR219_07050 [Clostridiales bacterium]